MRKNKKGFTLVELLAVIVILALIMGIAVVSIGGVLSTAREKTYRETAAGLINGVRQQLYIENKINEGTYTFPSSILEKGGESSPYGGSFNYVAATDCAGSGDYKGTAVGTLCKLTTAKSSCSKTEKAFVIVTKNVDTYAFKICLSDGSHYVFAEEKPLLEQDSTNAPIN